MNLVARQRTEDPKRHCQSMVAMGPDRAPQWRGRTHDSHSVLQLRCVGADGAQIRNDRADAIALLDAKLGGAGDHCFPLGPRGDAGKEWQLIDHGWNDLTVNVNAAE